MFDFSRILRIFSFFFFLFLFFLLLLNFWFKGLLPAGLEHGLEICGLRRGHEVGAFNGKEGGVHVEGK